MKAEIALAKLVQQPGNDAKVLQSNVEAIQRAPSSERVPWLHPEPKAQLQQGLRRSRPSLSWVGF